MNPASNYCSCQCSKIDHDEGSCWHKCIPYKDNNSTGSSIIQEIMKVFGKSEVYTSGAKWFPNNISDYEHQYAKVRKVLDWYKRSGLLVLREHKDMVECNLVRAGGECPDHE